MLSAAANLIWFLLNGLVLGLAWWLWSLLAFISIIGIPWGRACFQMGRLAFFPFGRDAISRKELSQKSDVGTGVAGIVGNVIWFVFAGFWLAVLHLIWAIFNFLTIIGIPFGIQHLKLAGIAIAPIGKVVVKNDVAQAARKANAESHLNDLRK
ncbi:YccF domain-containing protein [Saccharospirillum salsuginis]|uniref:Inner membrane protein YccF n=1 Tax=Saccharospirillum salsuginis TaxID=418750 RepID=A0A918K7Z2_9GAMM|nr:YccF domain-containing protein [Saccharospirillum salsuginis]GGX52168.1 hypothetical protein GCM10007392_19370 [Saccharospirillum salsuginis]